MEVPLARMRELAGLQHGVLLLGQLTEVGLSRRSLDRLCRDGWLRRVRPGAYALGGVPSPWEPAVAAVMVAGPDVALSHGTAAAFHRLPGLVHSGSVELTVVLPRHPRLPGTVLHRVRRPLGDDLEIVKGLPITTASRTIVDISTRLGRTLLAHTVDEGCIAGLWTIDKLEAVAGSLGGRGRARLDDLAAVLAERHGRPSGDSWLENRVIGALQSVGPFEVQYQLVLDAQVVILDIAWPDVRVAVESDGWEVRSRSRGKFDRDRRKANLLAAHGWVVLHATSVMSDAEILDMAARVLRRRGVPLPLDVHR